ncbi:unnamed protein product, partial [Prorocentrum cordatum]
PFRRAARRRRAAGLGAGVRSACAELPGGRAAAFALAGQLCADLGRCLPWGVAAPLAGRPGPCPACPEPAKAVGRLARPEARWLHGLFGIPGLRATVVSPDHDPVVEWFSEGKDDIRSWCRVGLGRVLIRADGDIAPVAGGAKRRVHDVAAPLTLAELRSSRDSRPGCPLLAMMLILLSLRRVLQMAAAERRSPREALQGRQGQAQGVQQRPRVAAGPGSPRQEVQPVSSPSCSEEAEAQPPALGQQGVVSSWRRSCPRRPGRARRRRAGRFLLVAAPAAAAGAAAAGGAAAAPAAADGGAGPAAALAGA